MYTRMDTTNQLHSRRAIFAGAGLALLQACGSKKPVVARPQAPAGRTPPPPPVATGSTERGVASWYGIPYNGRHAADGEIYDMETLVAAHRTLPFHTRVSVRNLTNGKTVEVRIIDRGPFVNNRIIDLSHAAAKAIDMLGPGTAQVELTVLGAPAGAGPAAFGVQVGAFRDKANADRLQKTMVETYGAAKLVLRDGDPPLWRVLVGHASTTDEAERLAARLRAEQKFNGAFVIRLDP